LTDPAQVDEVIVIIGGKGRLSPAEGILAAQSFISSQRHYKNAEFSISLSGYDNVTDELWRDPDIVDYITLVTGEIAYALGDDITLWRLSTNSLRIIGACLSNGLTQQ
jgi:hypothetical protein